ncbi:MAG: hypothetical protein NC299_00310 [Lachnospiraceae bacterium]|nr:hypothetical protein [Ruminococcus sp.]MCM1273788.1 hypothetical protein [Lachnospiraceae bacterium]
MGIDTNQLNRKVVERLKKKIVIAERVNLKTKNKSDSDMVKDIKKNIEEEVKCCSDQSN